MYYSCDELEFISMVHDLDSSIVTENVYLDNFFLPLIECERSNFWDMDPETSMHPWTLNTHDNANIDACPIWTFRKH